MLISDPNVALGIKTGGSIFGSIPPDPSGFYPGGYDSSGQFHGHYSYVYVSLLDYELAKGGYPNSLFQFRQGNPAAVSPGAPQGNAFGSVGPPPPDRRLYLPSLPAGLARPKARSFLKVMENELVAGLPGAPLGNSGADSEKQFPPPPLGNSDTVCVYIGQRVLRGEVVVDRYLINGEYYDEPSPEIVVVAPRGPSSSSLGAPPVSPPGPRPSIASLTEEVLYRDLKESRYSAAALNRLNKHYERQFPFLGGNLRGLLLKRSAAFATAFGGQWRQGDYLYAIHNLEAGLLDLAGATIAGETWGQTTWNLVTGILTGGVLGAAFGALGGSAATSAVAADTRGALGPKLGSSLPPEAFASVPSEIAVANPTYVSEIDVAFANSLRTGPLLRAPAEGITGSGPKAGSSADIWYHDNLRVVGVQGAPGGRPVNIRVHSENLRHPGTGYTLQINTHITNQATQGPTYYLTAEGTWHLLDPSDQLLMRALHIPAGN